MAKLAYTVTDKTLVEIDKILEWEELQKAPRNYLGMSEIGHPCWRKCFYSFRGVRKREISASGIKAIQDGFSVEDIMAARLRKVKSIELHTVDPENPEKQIGFSDHKGHFRGHADGMIKGILESSLWHVWENKAVNDEKFDKFVKIKEEKGEKETLKEWDIVYYAQGILYMHYSAVPKHYITVNSPGGRRYVSARTEANNSEAEKYIQKAHSIIFDDFTIPARLSDKPEYFECKWCAYNGVCHEGEFPDIHCKSCRYRECIDDGKSKCLLKDEVIPEVMIHVGCPNHLYNPALIDAQFIEHQEHCVLYRTHSGLVFANCSATGFPEDHPSLESVKDLPIYTSEALKNKIKKISDLSKDTAKIIKVFGGETTSKSERKQWETAVDSRLIGIK